ncbi:MAG: DUF2851 family protein [Cyclobacteriaceae bacterium]
MNESFLHYIWQFQYFDKKDLRSSTGEEIVIFNPGNKNTHAGPDFYNAKLKIESIEWAGSVEIHIHSSGWYEHKHQEDPAYENVVLHVVWDENEKIIRKDGTLLPTLELNTRIAPAFILQYKRIIHSRTRIPCASAIGSVPDLIRISMLDKALMSRLESKASTILKALEKSNGDWEETCYQMLCRNFGFKVNTEPFLQLAQSLPYKILMKHGDRSEQMEALIFGQAGFLNETINDPYYLLLKREYTLLRKKYNLSARQMNKAQWRFLRLRPANFPTIRLAQLASVLYHQKNIFSRIISTTSWKELMPAFSIKPSAYWLYHYRFFKKQKKEIPSLGRMSMENILINSIVPMLVAYGKARDDQRFTDRALQLLQETGTEKNNILRSWEALGMNSKTAFDSQALIELHNSFCIRRRCLDCNIGFALLAPPLNPLKGTLTPPKPLSPLKGT